MFTPTDWDMIRDDRELRQRLILKFLGDQSPVAEDDKAWMRAIALEIFPGLGPLFAQYKLTKYAPVPGLQDQVWWHSKLGTSVGVGPNLLAALPSLLQGPDAEDRDHPRSLFLHALTQELVSRGLLVPADQSEEQYLSSIQQLRAIKPGMFFLPHATLEDIKDQSGFAILGIPCNLGGLNPGSEMGPTQVREASKSLAFRTQSPLDIYSISQKKAVFEGKHGWDLGDVALERLGIDDWIRTIGTIYSRLPLGIVPIAVGGDHTFSLPMIKALYEKHAEQLLVVHIDQHLDIQFWGDWAVGNAERLHAPIHSNFVSHLAVSCPKLKFLQLGVAAFQSLPPGPEASQYLQKIGNQFSDIDVMSCSIESFFSGIHTDAKIYITLDVDALSELVCTGYPSATGISYTKLLEIMRYICEKFLVVGLDIMEFGVSQNHESEASRREAGKIATIILHFIQSCGARL